MADPLFGSHDNPLLLTWGRFWASLCCPHGGVLVSTWEIRQRRHAEDGSLASLIIEPNINC